MKKEEKMIPNITRGAQSCEEESPSCEERA
jgi:hypothetical protein